MIKIEFCKKNNSKEVQRFIHLKWKKNHILSKKAKLFKWLYENKKYYNFIIAKKNEKIIGLLGFIKNSHFSKTSSCEDIIWLALWKVDEKKTPPGLGLLLLKKLRDKNPKLDIAVIGINNLHPPLYRRLNFKVNKMDHFYLINPYIKKFKIIKFQNKTNHKKIFRIEKNINFKIIDLKFLKNKGLKYLSKNFTSYKNSNFFINKYIKHPFYKYKLFHLKLGKKNAIIVFRTIKVKSSKIIRVIDFEGDESIILNLGNFFRNIVFKEKAEYLDFLQYGINKKYFFKAGFKLLDHSKDTIIPNYFEPLVEKNKSVYFAYNINKNHKLKIFKGDGDQDRPNLINK